MGQEAQRVGRAQIQAGTLVLNLKIGLGDHCSKEDGDIQHQGAYGVEGETFTELEKVCIGIVSKIEPVRWSEGG